ncbi:MAG: TRAP transporter large permease subunit [Oscillospiraceae bacterium]|nr:TRAP transporter large permease subunit [Oscillospiraceae bacterium]
MLQALILFALTYIAMLLLPRWRPLVALISAALFVLTGMLPLGDALASIDFNVLLMIAGTMGTVALVIESQLPYLLSDIIIEHVPNVKWAIVILALFAGVISAFIDNVATVLMVAPIAVAIAKRLDISPVRMVIAISVASNLQGAATLVGDTTSILLGSYANMSFNDFFWYHGRPGIFFAVELGAVGASLVLLFLMRRENAPVLAGTRTVVTDYVPGLLLLATILLLIVASLFPARPALTNGVICVGVMFIGAVYSAVRKKSLRALLLPFREIDYLTILLLFGLFVVVGGITEMGVVDAIAQLLARLGSGNLFLIYTILIWGSVAVSAFIDNIPYVATMLPVTQSLAAGLGADPTVLYFGLLCGATLGGNLTPIGASANITGIGILRKEGHEVTTRDFLSIGVPFTLAAVIPAYIYLWIFYGL